MNPAQPQAMSIGEAALEADDMRAMSAPRAHAAPPKTLTDALAMAVTCGREMLEDDAAGFGSEQRRDPGTKRGQGPIVNHAGAIATVVFELGHGERLDESTLSEPWRRTLDAVDHACAGHLAAAWSSMDKNEAEGARDAKTDAVAAERALERQAHFEERIGYPLIESGPLDRAIAEDLHVGADVQGPANRERFAATLRTIEKTLLPVIREIDGAEAMLRNADPERYADTSPEARLWRMLQRETYTHVPGGARPEIASKTDPYSEVSPLFELVALDPSTHATQEHHTAPSSALRTVLRTDSTLAVEIQRARSPELALCLCHGDGTRYDYMPPGSDASSQQHVEIVAQSRSARRETIVGRFAPESEHERRPTSPYAPVNHAVGKLDAALAQTLTQPEDNDIVPGTVKTRVVASLDETIDSAAPCVVLRKTDAPLIRVRAALERARRQRSEEHGTERC